MGNDHLSDWLQFLFGIALSFTDTITPSSKYLLWNVEVSISVRTENWGKEYNIIRASVSRALANLFPN